LFGHCIEGPDLLFAKRRQLSELAQEQTSGFPLELYPQPTLFFAFPLCIHHAPILWKTWTFGLARIAAYPTAIHERIPNPGTYKLTLMPRHSSKKSTAETAPQLQIAGSWAKMPDTS
jgi:hypothetical protein